MHTGRQIARHVETSAGGEMGSKCTPVRRGRAEPAYIRRQIVRRHRRNAKLAEKQNENARRRGRSVEASVQGRQNAAIVETPAGGETNEKCAGEARKGEPAYTRRQNPRRHRRNAQAAGETE
ncbi:MAG: hypothetical protein ACLTDS_10535 [Bianqueaceae bacterium]